MVWLLDGNVLTALALENHVHHVRALNWFYAVPRDFATCAITEGTLLRMHMMSASDGSASAAWATLRLIRSMPNHVFWDDGHSYAEVDEYRLTGHRQVTDAWLAELARRHKARIATMDAGLVAVHSDVADFIPVV